MFGKQIVRKIFRKLTQRIEYHRVMHYNKKYKRAISVLFDESVLTNKISQIRNIVDSGQTTYYIISQSNEKVGIFGYINCFLPHIAYAVAKGYIPVIDMESHIYIYTPKGKNINVWEMFFEQPCNIGLNDIKHGKIVNCPDYLWYRWMPNSCPPMHEKEVKMWSKLYRSFVRLNQKSAAYCDTEYNELLHDNGRVCGVIYRGTTYTKGHAKGHPIQPTMDMLADKVNEVIKDRNCEKIYLASDEKSIVEFFNKKFPNKVIVNKRMYYDEVDVDYGKYNVDGSDITGDLFDRDNNEYLIGIEYISSMYLVSKCCCFVGGACGGTTAVQYINDNKFEYSYIFELGKYGE